MSDKKKKYSQALTINSIWQKNLLYYDSLQMPKIPLPEQKKTTINFCDCKIDIIEDNSIPDGEIHSFPPYQKFKFKKDE